MRIKFTSINYYKLILIHIGLAPILLYLTFLDKIFGVALIVLGYLYVVRNQNRNEEALYVAGYMVGIEVFLKMTNSSLVYEIGKYSVMGFLILGMYYKGFSKNAGIYWLFLVILTPGLIVASYNLNFDTVIRKTMAFNISGPVCLGISSIYCYRRKFTLKQLTNLLLVMGLPVVSTVTVMFFVAPVVKDYVRGTASNVSTSGNWAANQVATIVGLGLFCFFVRILFNSKEKMVLLLNIVIVLIFSFRGIATFSRGGILTSFFMIILLTLIVYAISNSRVKFNILKGVIVSGVALFGLWTYTSIQTNGMINKRYANQDPSGKEKASKFTGREVIFDEEIKFFLENPFFGIGVGKSREARLDDTGIDAASHSELSRMLSEHGAFGILGLLILFITPLILYIDNKEHIFLLPFFIFWFFTINHAAMRLAAPAFVYALTLLKVQFNETPALHREQTV